MTVIALRVVAEVLWPDQGDTEASPNPDPRATRATESDPMAKAPPITAPQDTAERDPSVVLAISTADPCRSTIVADVVAISVLPVNARPAPAG